MAVFPQRQKSSADPPRQNRSAVRKVSHNGLTWYNFTTLGEADMRYLQRHFRFHQLDYEDLVSTKQRPKLDEYPDYLFIIFHVPYYDRRNKRLVQEEVDVFIGQHFLVTIHSARLKVLEQLFTSVRDHADLRTEYMGKGSGFLLYEMISRLYENCFPMLDRIAERINQVEREIFAGRSKQMVEELSHLKLEIINFRRVIRPQRALVGALEANKQKFLPDNLEIYFDDVQDAISRSADLLDNYKEVVESLEDTNESYIQHRTNNVVKVLTVISLITLPVSTVAAVLGMNVAFPFAASSATFVLSIFLPLAFVAAIYAYIFYKRWL